MPFADDFDDLYQFGIKKTAEDLGIVAERVDEQQFSETILERVYRQIENSDFIIADMTGQNPNVFYEVGYAHAKGKTCALITQNASDIPFDLKHHAHVIYDGTLGDLVGKLTPKLQWLKDETAKSKERRISATCKASSGFLKVSEYKHIGNFDLEVMLRNQSDVRSAEIEAYYLVTTRAWVLSVAGSDCPYDDFETGDGQKRRKHLVKPNIRRLAPTAFEQIKVVLERTFWNKWDGQEKRSMYVAKGSLEFEVVTSEGTLLFDFPLTVSFDESPF